MSPITFIVSQLLILVIGLSSLGGLYYYLNHENPIKSTSNIPLTKEPTSLTLDVTSPPDDLLSFTKEILISGKTTPLSKILISNESSDIVVDSKASGNFSYDFELQTGINNLTITVFDDNGEKRAVQKTVFYSKEKI